ncbi:hypothetical protein HMSSN036_79260 [Paenibacillus macerans]|nr:hypothetical protein HMSSN036_79260 [Paenibacillus macerans]
MNVSKVISTISEKTENGITEVYLVACGGSLVDMYPAKYFWKANAQSRNRPVHSQ